LAGGICLAVALKPLGQRYDFLWCGHE
jgi:hypothetical protein